ncbi:MCM2/3/5 family-domain-containing protein [Blyttiomyces helicus]|uniref:DNA helicase n=1 Tax=Blyttiomyces helicus TaxID=388810 RepID=A0A4P9VZM4_9FUNG|nr:MCM2/3/5 family-domain-containing protein [Blyttiomyces helicus]|eukprot:RKO85279.1 MCM2/3/5 family-domain-containing protein [Blyttiomyces helicus]
MDAADNGWDRGSGGGGGGRGGGGGPSRQVESIGWNRGSGRGRGGGRGGRGGRGGWRGRGSGGGGGGGISGGGGGGGAGRRNRRVEGDPCPYLAPWELREAWFWSLGTRMLTHLPRPHFLSSTEPYTDTHESVPVITSLITYFARFFQLQQELGASAADAESDDETDEVLVDYKDLQAHSGVAEMDMRLRERPADTLACLGLAVDEAMRRRRSPSEPRSSPSGARPKTVRIVNHTEITPLKNLKSNLFGKFITVRGTIVRVSSVGPQVSHMAFTCETCNERQTVKFTDGKYAPPSRCVGFHCKGRGFAPDRWVGSGTETVDWQRVRVQEKLADNEIDAGRIPRTVECELAEYLVDSVVPGDVVSVSGIVKVLAAEEGKGKNKTSEMHIFYLDANYLSKVGAGAAPSSSGSAPSSTSQPTPPDNQEETCDDPAADKDHVELSDRELAAIREIVAEGDVFRLLVHSLCPSIFGHDIVKGVGLNVNMNEVRYFRTTGLLLTLFGGRRRNLEENEIAIRSDPHILVVGDPGLGKSQLLSATVKVAPRGVYVCGNTTTTSGLTVTLSKDADTGDTALEAGALVLGDRGVCCIDELDKMTEHQALLEAMEQQSISIAKAGMVCSLPARTSVVAAANPVGGHYSKGKTVSENLKMNTALLSRFDLVFILLDRPDQDMDRFLSEHIMKVRWGSRVASLREAQEGGTGQRLAAGYVRYTP